MEFDEFEDLTPEQRKKLEEDVAHDIAIMEKRWAAMGPPPPTEAEELTGQIIDRMALFERRLLVCVGLVGFTAVITMVVLLRR